MAKSRKKYDQLKFPVVFKGMGSGKKRISIGVDMPYGAVSPKDPKPIDREEYWEHFVQKVLKVAMEADPNSKRDAKGQQSLIDDNTILLENVAEVAGFTAGSCGISFRLSFPKGAGVSADSLDEFVGQSGTLSWTVKGDREQRHRGKPKGDDEDGDEEPEEVDFPE